LCLNKIGDLLESEHARRWHASLKAVTVFDVVLATTTH
jgi:hypothetical protein